MLTSVVRRPAHNTKSPSLTCGLRLRSARVRGPETRAQRWAARAVMRRISGWSDSRGDGERPNAGDTGRPRPSNGALAGASGWCDSRGNGERPNAAGTGGASPSNGALASASGWCETQTGVERTTASVSLTMIVKNAEDRLGKCLESVRGLFDELIIVDTGSTDRTKEIAREFGAKVFDFVWIDDFAAARNVALSHATSDYAFWLDADDVIEPAEREKLRALLGGLAVPAVCSAAAAARRLRRGSAVVGGGARRVPGRSPGAGEAKARARSCGGPTPRFSVNGDWVTVAAYGSIPPIDTVVAQGAPVTREGCAKQRKRCANERILRFALPAQLFL